MRIPPLLDLLWCLALVFIDLTVSSVSFFFIHYSVNWSAKYVNNQTKNLYPFAEDFVTNWFTPPQIDSPVSYPNKVVIFSFRDAPSFKDPTDILLNHPLDLSIFGFSPSTFLDTFHIPQTLADWCKSLSKDRTAVGIEQCHSHGLHQS